jgi:type VI secretion system protein VasG
MTAEWEQERDAVQRVLDLRKAMASAQTGAATPEHATPPAAEGGDGDGAGAGVAVLETAADTAADTVAPEDAGTAEAASQADLDAAMAGLTARQGEGRGMIHYEVGPEVVAQVIADWTGIPVDNMLRADRAAIMGFAERLRARIKGQDHAVTALDNGMRTAKAGLQNPSAPLGVFLFVGPSGVGKTETGLGIADLLFGGERFMTTINMSEFQEKHTVSRLIGSPPGYVGYGEGGRLTEAVRQRPYSVVLLDEVEKADLEVMNLFYQVFDKGQLADGEGRVVDFKNTVVILTSNLATDIISEMGSGEEPADVATITEAIRPVLSGHFKPALLARMQIVPFLPIGQGIMRDIVRLKLARIADRLAERHRMRLGYDDAVIDQIARRCTEVETGARNVDHIVNGTLLPEMSSRLLEVLDDEQVPQGLTVGVSEEGRFTYTFA